MLTRSCDAASADETDRKPDTGGLGAVADSLLRVTADCLIRTATQTQRGWVGGALMLPLRDNQRRLAPLQPPPSPLLILLAVVCSLGRARQPVAVPAPDLDRALCRRVC